MLSTEKELHDLFDELNEAYESGEPEMSVEEWRRRQQRRHQQHERRKKPEETAPAATSASANAAEQKVQV